MSRGYTIYCVDFDGTLNESKFPDIGSPNMALIEHLKKRRAQGNKLILWTCRVGERLQEAVEWCRQYEDGTVGTGCYRSADKEWWGDFLDGGYRNITEEIIA